MYITYTDQLKVKTEYIEGLTNVAKVVNGNPLEPIEQAIKIERDLIWTSHDFQYSSGFYWVISFNEFQTVSFLQPVTPSGFLMLSESIENSLKKFDFDEHVFRF